MKLRPHPSCARSLVVILESDIQGINNVFDNSVWDELSLIIPAPTSNLPSKSSGPSRNLDD